MACKNCGKELRTDFNYCPDCGAKVIRNRLTLKNLWFDIKERYFNVDNTFTRTFLHLFTRPEEVIDGYITGTRKKYLNPISYLAIALTLSGISLFLLRKVFIDDIDFAVVSAGRGGDVGRKIMEAIFDYSSFIFMLYIPVIALAGWLTLNKRQYLISEYFVVGIYSLAHYNICSFPIAMAAMFIAPAFYFQLSWPLLIAMFSYCLYAAHSLNLLKPTSRILRSLIYFVICGAGYMAVSISMAVLLFLSGEISIADFAPPPK